MKKILEKYWWVVLIAVIITSSTWRMLFLRSIGYEWIESGFTGKTWWDILELLIIPITLAGLVIVIEYFERKKDRELNLDNQRERLLQNYFNTLTGLILDKKLKESNAHDEVREIARIKTLTTLKRLDRIRKSALLEFLLETELIQAKHKGDPIISLKEANLKGARLVGACLDNAHLVSAQLQGARLMLADLRGACLVGACLDNAHLEGAHMDGALLTFTKFDEAIMPDGKEYNPKIHTTEYLAGKKLEEE
jgi:uncharacterized membrane protein